MEQGPKGARRIARSIVAAVILLAASLAPAAAADDAARALLPEAIRSKGVIAAAMPLDFEPYNFLDAKNEQVGYDVDILKAIAEVLGVKADIQRLGFASIIPSVAGGRVDIGMSVMGITEARLKQVSFVRYTILAEGLIVRKGNPTHIDPANPCGHSIAVEKGTHSVGVWEDIAKKCDAAGKGKIELMTFDGKGPQVLAIEAGRADAAGLSYATALVAAQHSDGKLEGAPGGPVPGYSVDAGIAFKKDNEALAKALEAALKVVVANGTYGKINEKWGLSAASAAPAIVQ